MFDSLEPELQQDAEECYFDGNFKKLDGQHHEGERGTLRSIFQESKFDVHI